MLKGEIMNIMRGITLRHLDVGGILAWITMFLLWIFKVVDSQIFILFVLLKFEFIFYFRDK